MFKQFFILIHCRRLRYMSVLSISHFTFSFNLFLTRIRYFWLLTWRQLFWSNYSVGRTDSNGSKQSKITRIWFLSNFIHFNWISANLPYSKQTKKIIINNIQMKYSKNIMENMMKILHPMIITIATMYDKPLCSVHCFHLIKSIHIQFHLILQFLCRVIYRWIQNTFSYCFYFYLVLFRFTIKISSFRNVQLENKNRMN